MPHPTEELGEELAALGLVDHHAHGALAADLDRRAFEAALTESDRPAAPGTSAFDSQAGVAVLAHCAPVLDLDRHCGPDDYLRRRAELGAGEVNRRLLRATGAERFLIDTGFATEGLLGVRAMAASSGRPCQEVVRLEVLAEDAMAAGCAAADFAADVTAALHRRLGAGAVGTKSIAAYRGGLDVGARRPAPGELAGAVSRWRASIEAGTPVRCEDPTVISFLLWLGVDAGVPLQVHTGFGDTDLHLGRANPLLLTDFLRASEAAGTPVVLLHCYPFHREAGYLCQMFPHAYFDVGEALVHVGARSPSVVAEALELGPFTKQLYSSDAWGLAEFHHLGALWWRRSMAATLGRFVSDGDWSMATARRVATLIGRDNARRCYRLEG